MKNPYRKFLLEKHLLCLWKYTNYELEGELSLQIQFYVFIFWSHKYFAFNVILFPVASFHSLIPLPQCTQRRCSELLSSLHQYTTAQPLTFHTIFSFLTSGNRTCSKDYHCSQINTKSTPILQSLKLCPRSEKSRKQRKQKISEKESMILMLKCFVHFEIANVMYSPIHI